MNIKIEIKNEKEEIIAEVIITEDGKILKKGFTKTIDEAMELIIDNF